MSRHLEAIRKILHGTPIRAAGEGLVLAVAVTEDEVITGKAKLFGATVERFKLDEVSSVRVVPNPSANLLEIEFTGPPPRSLTAMYGPSAVADFEHIVALVRRHAGGNRQ